MTAKSLVQIEPLPADPEPVVQASLVEAQPIERKGRLRGIVSAGEYRQSTPAILFLEDIDIQSYRWY
jgi:hypothetical protein